MEVMFIKNKYWIHIIINLQLNYVYPKSMNLWIHEPNVNWTNEHLRWSDYSDDDS